MSNSTVSYSTVFNSTGSSENDQYDDPNMHTFREILPVSIIFGMGVVVACTSGILNYFVLVALARVKSTTLRAKCVIQASAVINMLLPIIEATNLPFILSIFRNVGSGTSLCFSAVYYNIETVCFYVRPGCTIFLACDRIYAIGAPLVYHTVGYKAWSRLVIVLAPWIIAIGIWLTFLSLTIVSAPAISNGTVCETLYDTHVREMSSRILDIYLLTFSGLSFLVYIGVFIGVKYRRAGIQRASDSTLKRKSLSLAVSFFLLNTITLFLYAPLPIYGSSVNWSSLRIGQYNGATLKGLTYLYLCNCFIDPLLLIFRIRSIRQNLPFSISVCNVNRKQGMENGDTNARRNDCHV